MYRARTLVTNVLPLLPQHAPERLSTLLVLVKSKGQHQAIMTRTNSSSSNANTNQTASTVGNLTQNRQYVTTAALEPFLNGSSSVYVEDMYNAWLNDHKSVHASWDAFFKNATAGAQPGEAYAPPPPLYNAPSSQRTFSPDLVHSLVPGTGLTDERIIDDHLAVQAIIRSYQTRGHNVAQLDPLGISSADLDTSTPAELVLKSYSLGKIIKSQTSFLRI